ncbi:MAG: A24 family peptidase C-terminal domain-containing protein [Candidatus Diapherotrites archaeon]|nr:A24 family peptidase C-terminal domain-containing protein [Candidatus Diapherotrites archaeon]
MLLETIRIGIVLIGLAHASYTDLKTRLVDDRVIYGLIAAGVLLHLMESYAANDWSLFFTMAATALLTFAGAYLLWRIGFWAGGDVQLFAGIATLVPTIPGMPVIATPWGFGIGLFPLTVFVLSLFAMIPVGILFALRKLRKDTRLRDEVARKLLAQTKSNLIAAAGLGGLAVIAGSYGLSWLATLAVAFVFVFLPKQIQPFLAAALAIGGLYLNAAQWLLWSAQTGAALIALGTILLTGRTKALFRSEKKVSELAEGDVIAEDIIQEDGVVKMRPAENIQTIINHLWAQDKRKAQQVIWSGYQTNGVEKADIMRIQELAAQGKIPQTLPVKETTPFVPAILVGFLAALGIGAWIWKTMGL